jgi:exopolysaccharide biosynthesis polyprenyl glycosylphosphotransferase
MSVRQKLAGGAAEPAVAELGALSGAADVGRASRSILRERHGHRDYVIRRVLAAGDACGIALALLVAAALDGRAGSNLDIVTWGLLTIPMWAVLFKLYGLYDRDLKRVSHSTVDDLPWLFHALVVGTLLTWLLFKGLPAGPLPFASVMGFALTALLDIAILRTFVRSMAIRVLGPERVVLVGSERMTQVLVRKMRAHRAYGLEPVGVILPGESDRAPEGLDVLNGTGDIAEIALQHGAHRLVLSHSDLGEDQVLDIVRRCKELAIKVSLLPQVVDALGPSVEIDDVEGVTLLGINPPVLGRSSRVMKRCLDVAGAGVLILFFLPLLAVVAIVIKLDSRGPVFFRQSRVGKGGKRFDVLKLRTMYRDAEQRRQELLAESIDPNWLHLRNDPRITRVGRRLRHLSLDELPQLWNVLRGEMSLVGPRPLIESEDQMIGGWGRSRLDLTPGMTGVWQVLGRTNIPFDEMVKLDYLYVTNWSLWTDISLILRTLPAVVTQRGAN